MCFSPGWRNSTGLLLRKKICDLKIWGIQYKGDMLYFLQFPDELITLRSQNPQTSLVLFVTCSFIMKMAAVIYSKIFTQTQLLQILTGLQQIWQWPQLSADWHCLLAVYILQFFLQIFKSIYNVICRTKATLANHSCVSCVGRALSVTLHSSDWRQVYPIAFRGNSVYVYWHWPLKWKHPRKGTRLILSFELWIVLAVQG